MAVLSEDIVILVSGVLGVDGSTIHANTLIADLIVDSIEYIELAMEIQECFDVPVDELPDHRTVTVAGLAEFINEVSETASDARSRLSLIKTPYCLPLRPGAGRNVDIEID